MRVVLVLIGSSCISIFRPVDFAAKDITLLLTSMLSETTVIFMRLSAFVVATLTLEADAVNVRVVVPLKAWLIAADPPTPAAVVTAGMHPVVAIMFINSKHSAEKNRISIPFNYYYCN